ncbi:hypothetical protein LZL87_007042 [Fusarium oxysporum]|nr:hypothetical protein LZL87_007042 [Fusarium oxysporum]
MDIDEQPLPEFDSDSDSDTDYVSKTTNFPPLVDKHDMGFAEQTKCLTRDGNVCVVTGTTGPNAYHNAPFTWNDTQAHIKQTKENCSRRAYVLGCDVAHRTGYLDDIFEPEASD